ncbi:DUF5667 domain-containing protein [Embleya sp. NPDC020630]|uniref:DUF5667 domain-containing protein n=1 Tax=Embleya sp. NPDC020630 TaxID=3363979 RepID=UPI0037997931
MSIAALDRRPASAFARALDENDRDNRSAEPLPALVPLLRTAEMLRERSSAAPVPSADFRTALRQRLLDEAAALPATEGAATVPAPRGAHRRRESQAPPRTVRWRRRAAIAGAFVVVTGGGLGGVAYASSDALPGDLTYGVKRTVEDFKISLADNDHERGERYLQQADTRMGEAERLLRRAGRSPDKDTVRHLRQVLDDWREEADKGRALLTDHFRKSGSDGSMRNLADFARSGNERMERIGDRLPPELHSERDRVRTLLTAINEQVAPIAGTPDRSSAKPGTAGHTDGAPAAPGTAPGGAPGTGGLPLVPRLPGLGGGATNGAPSQGGSTTTGGAAPPQQPQQDGGLLPGLNIPLLGGAPAQSPSDRSDGSGGTPAPAKTPKGQILPPLLPGLPGIGLNLLGPAEEEPHS